MATLTRDVQTCWGLQDAHGPLEGTLSSPGISLRFTSPLSVSDAQCPASWEQSHPFKWLCLKGSLNHFLKCAYYFNHPFIFWFFSLCVAIELHFRCKAIPFTGWSVHPLNLDFWKNKKHHNSPSRRKWGPARVNTAFLPGVDKGLHYAVAQAFRGVLSTALLLLHQGRASWRQL